MRLSPYEIKIIVETAHRLFGEEVSVLLFGSRVDDSRRGGDIDLLLKFPHRIEQPIDASIRFGAALQYALGDQEIDVVIDDGPSDLPIHRVANQSGVVLSA